MAAGMVDEPGGSYWRDWRDYMEKHLLKAGLISPADMSLFKVTDNPLEAFHEVMQFYCVYNSMRYVRDKLYIRLHSEPKQSFVDQLNRDFADILTDGKIEKADAHPLEADDEHLAELPRLLMHFNRRDFGRLRQMVDAINAEMACECD